MNGRGIWAFVMQTRWARGSLSMGRGCAADSHPPDMTPIAAARWASREQGRPTLVRDQLLCAAATGQGELDWGVIARIAAKRARL